MTCRSIYVWYQIYNHVSGYRYLTETSNVFFKKEFRNVSGLNVVIVDLDCTKPKIHRGKVKCREGQDEVSIWNSVGLLFIGSIMMMMNLH